MLNSIAKKFYEHFEADGLYEESSLEREVVQQVLTMLQKDYEFAKQVRSEKSPRWRIIFNAHYDIFRELCDLLMLFNRKKTSNHQAVFAFIVVHFPPLEFDWEILECIRKMRNGSKYEGKDISPAMWKSIELQFDLYIVAVQKKVEELLQE
ncbi:hypothetical protein HYX14_00925 [Candidatus Woesearchaeota archaeon]|nr:hypothetical protein [Candidatus Woesearchaeota archaeon]